ncbi:hypothetical protein [Tardiphaga sp.]|uniref:hypothetical protein n=1 Tax=Tardiphaga sp. TaxID=1926292 RepID=UPI0026042E94|nr:hypothetical protein [Tardiphaga sp.]MDB5616592.1 hypothetical protein [Tardiphaga sp.]
MEIGQNASADKPALRTRNILPHRRASQTIEFVLDGSRYQMTVGSFPDGSVGEIFLNADRADSLLDVLASDAAILASLALQYGCPLDAILHAVKRDGRGVPASPIGAALDRITP